MEKEFLFQQDAVSGVANSLFTLSIAFKNWSAFQLIELCVFKKCISPFHVFFTFLLVIVNLAFIVDRKAINELQFSIFLAPKWNVDISESQA